MHESNSSILNPELIVQQIAEVCDRNRDALMGIVKILMTNQRKDVPSDEGTAQICQTIAEIKAKAFISANEAALLFGCSAQHLRNLVQRALDGHATEPIPFCDLDGVVTFPVSELIEWSRKPKPKVKKATKKNKTHLKAVAS
jgi:hypothetical protein